MMHAFYSKLPTWLQSCIEKINQHQILEAFMEYRQIGYKISADTLSLKGQTNALNENELITVLFTNFFEAMIFSGQVHDVLMSGQQLSKLLEDPRWKEYEECAENIKHLTYFAKMGTELYLNPQKEPIKVLQNPWHNRLRQAAQEFSSLFREGDKIPLFQIFNEETCETDLPGLSSFSTGYLAFIDLKQLTKIPSILRQTQEIPLLWVFDSINTWAYAMSNEELGNKLLDTQSSQAFLIADRDPFTQAKSSITHVTQWQGIEETWPEAAPQEWKNALSRAALSWSHPQQNILSPTQQWRLASGNYARFIEHQHLPQNACFPILYRHLHKDWDDLSLLSIRHHSQFAQADKMALESYLAQFPKATEAPTQKKLTRIVHVTSQLMDHAHSPTKLLSLLTKYYNQDLYDLAVLTTETNSLKTLLYPCQQHAAPNSLNTAKHTLENFEKNHVAYSLAQGGGSFEDSVEQTLEKIIKICPDIIVFHGPEPLHIALAHRYPHCPRILFEHGSFPNCQVFDAIITSLEDTPFIEAQRLEELKMDCYVLPFCATSRSQWSMSPTDLSPWNIPKNAKIATTISNHLQTRLSQEFCDCVSQILEKVPNLYYAPLGQIKNLDEFLKRFDAEVRERIKPLGHHNNPSQFTRNMDLYFNEFPFGGCIGILDAMASGLPVVTKYDPKGPPQARYGGLFMDIERAVKNDEEYVKTAVSLMEDPSKLHRWSQHSFQAFEARSIPEIYVKKFEEILRECMEKAAERKSTK